MTKPANILDRINVASPCSTDWDSMTGNDQVRFCLHCSKHVNNISGMTRKQALELVSRSKGQLCLRYLRRPEGGIQTAERRPQLHQIRRRASRLATGAFTAALSLSSSIAAQTRAVTDEPIPGSIEVIDEQASSACPVAPDLMNGSVAGTVLDPNGALIPGVTITLVKADTGQQQSVVSNDEGQYRFNYLEAGAYTLRAEAMGFQSDERSDIVLQPGEEREVNLFPGVGLVEVTVGMVVALAPDEPLVKAAFENDLATVRNLIAAGVEVNRRDENTDTTALDEGVKYGNREMVRALLDAGAEINARSGRRQTALMRLDTDATDKLVWDLVGDGAKVNLKDEDGDTALILAASFSKTEVLRALLGAGAKVNAKNKAGATALMRAAEEGNLESVKLLIDFGANLSTRNNDGATALKLAEDNEHSDVVELLEAYSAPK